MNEFNQTNIESIYAIGDVTDRINLTPVAIAEGHAFSDREFGNINRLISYDNVPSAVFSQPPVSVVGLTLEDAKTLNICLLYTSPSPRDLWISRMPSSA